MACYVDCEYCYANRRIKGYNVLTGDFLCDLIKQMKQDGILQIDVNGGDVLLHPEIEKILDTLSKEGFSPLVSTKIPIKGKIIKLFKEHPNLRLQISLDSANQVILSDLISAPAGYLDEIRKTLQELSEQNIPVEINSVLTKKNGSHEDVLELLDFLECYSCVKKLKLNPTGFSIYKNNFRTIALSLSEVHSLENLIQKVKNNFKFDIRISGVETETDYRPRCRKEKFTDRAYCTGNTRNVVILPNGDVTVCEELYDHPAFIIGNVTKSTLKEIWNSQAALALYEKSHYDDLGDRSICQSCMDWDTCRRRKGVCWKSIIIAYGQNNWNYPDPRCPKAPPPYNDCYYK